MKQTEDNQGQGLVDWNQIYDLLERKNYGLLPGMVKGINDIEVLRYIIGVLCERLEEKEAE